MRRIRRPRNIPILIAGILVAAAFGLSSWAFVQAQQRGEKTRQVVYSNCVEIEKLKALIVGQSTFNLQETKLTLRQIGIDPASPNGKKLIKRAQRNSADTAALFAPTTCVRR